MRPPDLRDREREYGTRLATRISGPIPRIPQGAMPDCPPHPRGRGREANVDTEQFAFDPKSLRNGGTTSLWLA